MLEAYTIEVESDRYLGRDAEGMELFVTETSRYRISMPLKDEFGL